MSFPSSSSNFFEDCDLSFCCNPRFAAALAFLWLLILTIVCISLGSQIGEERIGSAEKGCFIPNYLACIIVIRTSVLN